MVAMTLAKWSSSLVTDETVEPALGNGRIRLTGKQRTDVLGQGTSGSQKLVETIPVERNEGEKILWNEVDKAIEDLDIDDYMNSIHCSVDYGNGVFGPEKEIEGGTAKVSKKGYPHGLFSVILTNGR